IFWGREAPEGALYDLALKLGADVPACLLGEACLVSGVGEEVAPLAAFPDIPCVLANPGAPLSTPSVFKAFVAREFSFTPPLFLDPLNLGDVWELLARTKNDLQGPACGLLPEVGKVLMALQRAKGAKFTRMSGSGATCFALFESVADAEAAARGIAKANPAWWVKKTMLGRRSRFLAGA
ncbi:MAG TPA: hypothetical protein VD713_00730, partial [Sphingomonadales bacterium]|nr:hypothetical protein [Sphingomonadales bacterium]